MQQILADKQIDWLLHFTRAGNLPNIFKHGLLPRSVLEQNNIAFSFNDEFRYDNCSDAVCTYSIRREIRISSSLNYKLFIQYRRILNESRRSMLIDK